MYNTVSDVTFNDILRYLEVTWSYPREAQAGNYTCEISTYGKYGVHFDFNATLIVPTMKPTFAELVSMRTIQCIQIKAPDCERLV